MFLQDGTIRHRRRNIDLPNHAHELTFTCYNKLKLLSKERTRQWLVEALDRTRRVYDLALWSYVIMPEHAHVLLLPLKEQYTTASILKSIKQSVGRRAINYLRKKHPNWLARYLTVHRPNGAIERHFWLPGGGYDRNIVSQRALVSAVHYIHANPFRRGLVESPAD